MDARLESGVAAAGEALARRLLAATSGVLAAALRPAPTPPVSPPLSPGVSPAPSPAGPASPPAPGPSHLAAPGTSAASVPAQRAHPPLMHTLYDVFRHLALEFPQQVLPIYTICNRIV